MWGHRIPAPDRDMANIPPFVPPASMELGPIARLVGRTIAQVLGAVIMLAASLIYIIEYRSLITLTDRGASSVLAFCAGLCIFLCGLALSRHSTLIATVLLAVGTLFGYLSTLIV